MADSPNVKVGVSVDNTNLFSGLQEATAGIKSFGKDIESNFKGLTSSITNMIAPLTAITGIVGGLGLAFGVITDIIKKLISIIPEAIDATAKLAENFENLAITAGMSTTDFNIWATTIQLAGGKVEDLESIVKGMEKGIKTNSDVLVANGIAVDEAALKHMTFGQYLQAVVDRMKELPDASDKDQLAMMAFGKSGVEVIAMLQRMNEQQELGQKIAAQTHILDQQAIEDAKQLRVAKAELEIQEQVLQRRIASGTTQYETAIVNAKREVIEKQNLIAEAHRLYQEGRIIAEGEVEQLETEQMMVINWDKMAVTAGKVLQADQKARLEAEQKAKDEAKAAEGKALVTKKMLEDKKAAEKKAEEEAKQAKQAIVELQKEFNSLEAQDVALQEAVTIQEKLQRANAEADIAYQNKELEIQEKLKKLKSEGAYNPAVQAAADRAIEEAWKVRNDKQKANQARADQEELDEANRVQEIKLNNQIKALDKQFAIDSQAIKNREALGQISATQAIAEQDVLDQKRYANEKAALEKELALNNLKAEKRQELNDRLLALEETREKDIAAIHQREALELLKDDGYAGALNGLKKYVEDTHNLYKEMASFATSTANSMASSMATAMENMLLHAKSLGAAMKSMMTEVATAVVSGLIKIAAQEATTWAARKVIAAWDSAWGIKKKAEQAADNAGVATNTAAKTANTAATTANAAAQTAHGTAIAATIPAIDTASASNMTLATAESFAAYASIPFVGEALAAAQVAIMFGELSAAVGAATAITALASGSLITQPTLALVGEAGNEMVMPERTAMDWMQQVYGDMKHSQATTQGYAGEASGYGSPNSSQASQTVNHHYNLSGNYFIGSSREGMDQASKAIQQLTNHYNMTYPG